MSKRKYTFKNKNYSSLDIFSDIPETDFKDITNEQQQENNNKDN